MDATADNSPKRKTIKNQILRMYNEPNEGDCELLSKEALNKTKNIRQKMEKNCINSWRIWKIS